MSGRLLRIYGPHHSVTTGEATSKWLTSELNLIHMQREQAEERAAELERQLARCKCEEVSA